MFKIIEVMCFDLNLIEMKLVIECLVRGRYNVELLELLVWLFSKSNVGCKDMLWN